MNVKNAIFKALINWDQKFYTLYRLPCLLKQRDESRTASDGTELSYQVTIEPSVIKTYSWATEADGYIYDLK